MAGMSRERKLELIALLLRGEGSDDEVADWIDDLSREIPNPHFGDLLVTAREGQTAEDILAVAERYRPIEL